MAKKKVSSSARDQEENQPQTKPQQLEKHSPGKMENLKTLNRLLMKETMERREQVHQLKSQLDELSEDQSFLSGIEHAVSHLVLSSQLSEVKNQCDRRAGERIQGVRKEHEAETRELMRNEADRQRKELERMQMDHRALMLETKEKEKRMGCLVERVASLTKSVEVSEQNLECVSREKDEIKKDLDRAVSERDASRMDLDHKGKVVRDLEMKVREMEINDVEIREALRKVQNECGLLVKEGKEREESLESLLQDKASVESHLAETQRSVEDLERKMEEMVESKNEEVELLKSELEDKTRMLFAMEEAKGGLTLTIHQLKAELSSSRDAFDFLKKEEEGLRLEVVKMENRDMEVQEELKKLQLEFDILLKQGKEKEESLESLLQDKASVESHLAETRQSVEDLERMMQENFESKDEEAELLKSELREKDGKLFAMEEANGCLTLTVHQLETKLSGSKDAFDLLKKEEEGLRLEATKMEIRNLEVQEELKKLQLEFRVLEKKKEEGEMRFDLQMEESTKQLNDLRRKMEEIVEEKDEIEGERAKQEVEIVKLQKEVVQLNSTISELQELCRDHVETSGQLRADRDAAQRDLNLQREEAGSLRLQVEELKKIKEGGEEELAQLRIAFDQLAAKKEEIKKHLNLLMEDKSSLESSLIAAQQGLRDMEKKMKTTEANSERALSLLRSTLVVMQHDSVEGQENGARVEADSEKELDEEIKPFAGELEMIKMAFRTRVGKIEDMNRKIELLQGLVAEARKKGGGLWKWLPSAIFAAISVAYVARGR